MVHKRGIAAGFVGVVIAASLTLSGCSIFPAAPSNGGGSGGTGQSGSGSGESGTSTDPGTDTGVEGLEGLPDTFPKDVPIVAGDVPVGIDLGTGWSVIVKVNNSDAAFEEATGKLAAAGFTEQVKQSSGNGSFADYITDKYEVQVTAQDMDNYGPSLTYVVVRKE